MNSKITLFALLFSVAVNVAVMGTLIYFWQHDRIKRQEIEVVHGAGPPHGMTVLLKHPDISRAAAEKIDSLRWDYHQKLVVVRADIDSTRQTIITHLMDEPVDRDTIDVIVRRLSDKQIDAERLTIDHLLAIKPLLPREDWQVFVRDLGPRHTIRTQVLKLDGDDSTSILVNEEVNEIKFYKGITKEHKKLIEEKGKQRRNP